MLCYVIIIKNQHEHVMFEVVVIHLVLYRKL